MELLMSIFTYVVVFLVPVLIACGYYVDSCSITCSPRKNRRNI